jgi:deoxyguanosine kinase
MLISIEGNIGSGKSTIIDFIKSQNRYVYIDEPVQEWLSIRDNQGNNALECFYKDQHKNAFCFQVLAYITRLTKLMEKINQIGDKNVIVITERSIETDKNVFAKMLYDDGMISSIEWETYNYWFDSFKKSSNVDHIIYVKTSPDKCLERINTRNRVEESNITLDYLTKCNNYHDNWINNSSTHIITIDGHDTIDNIRNKVTEILNSFY